MKSKGKVHWDSEGVRALRVHLGMTQQELADELGTRQQTISEWETGMYSPRGTSATLLSLVAERAGFAYRASAEEEPAGRRCLSQSPGAEPFKSNSGPSYATAYSRVPFEVQSAVGGCLGLRFVSNLTLNWGVQRGEAPLPRAWGCPPIFQSPPRLGDIGG